MARGLSLFFGLMLALAAVAALHGLGLSVWCVDVQPLPAVLRMPVLLVGAVLLVAFALYPTMSRWRCWATLAVLAALTALCLRDSVVFYLLWHAGRFRPGVPVPLSLVFAAALGFLARDALRPESASTLRVVAVLAACGIAFPILQMICFGCSDYRRPADAALVFGARAYADGRASQALEDRTLTACALYRAGLVHKLILSGGAGDGAITEPEAMRRVALAHGVPNSALVLDDAGRTTEASVEDARAIATRDGFARIIAVSHAYHLPRVKLELQHAHLPAVTVPAHEQRILDKMPWFVAREVAAYWLHLLDLAT